MSSGFQNYDTNNALYVNPTGATGSFQSKTGNATLSGATGFITLTVPANTCWIVQAIALVITTNATASNRQPIAVAEDASGNQFVNTQAAPLVTASNTVRVSYAPSLTLSSAYTNSNATAPFPIIYLGAGMSLVIGIASGGVSGDTINVTANVIVLPG